MRRLVILGLVFCGIGYLVLDWRSRKNEGPQPDDATFVERPVPAQRPIRQEEPLRQEEPEPAGKQPADDGALADLGFEPEGVSEEPQGEGFLFPDQDIDPLALPLCLLESWQADDASRLSTFLNEGAGAELPVARRKLMLAFWRALRGDPTTARALLDEIEGDEQITSAQLDLARRATGQSGAVAASMSAIARDPLARAMRMVLGDKDVQEASRAADPARMAEGLSELLLLEVGAPWAPRRAVLSQWAADLHKAQAGHRLDPAGNWPAYEYRVQGGENLEVIRKKVMTLNPGLNVCVGLIQAVNGLGQYIHEGDVLRIPTERVHVVVDLDARILLYLHGNEVVRAWDVGIGQEGQETPIGDWTIGEKLADPAYMPIGKPNLPYGHPDNPLGVRWLGLYRGGRDTSYGIHGTGDPAGVGGQVSLGCVRMRNEEVEELYEMLPLNSPVRIQP